MATDKMPGLAILLAKKKPDEPDGDEDQEDQEDDGGESSEAEDSATEAMMKALKTQDVKLFQSALKTFLETCYPSLAGE